MIRNHFRVALRNLRRHKMYSLINIGGLAVGMAVAIMIGLWVYDEVSYNRGYSNHDRMALFYRHNIDPADQKKAVSWFGTPQPVAKILTEKIRSPFQTRRDYVVGSGLPLACWRSQLFQEGRIHR